MRLASLAASLALASCASWRSVPVQSIDHERAMVFTDHTAYELSPADVHGQQVVGSPVRAWRITTCTYDASESPSEIARHCRWSVERVDSQDLAIEVATIRNVHVRRGHKRDILIISGALAITVIGFLGYMATVVGNED